MAHVRRNFFHYGSVADRGFERGAECVGVFTVELFLKLEVLEDVDLRRHILGVPCRCPAVANRATVLHLNELFQGLLVIKLGIEYRSFFQLLVKLFHCFFYLSLIIWFVYLEL